MVLPKFNKKYEREEEKGERENFEFWQREYRNSCCPDMKCVWSAQSEKKKKNCDNCGNVIAENGRKKINK